MRFRTGTTALVATLALIVAPLVGASVAAAAPATSGPLGKPTVSASPMGKHIKVRVGWKPNGNRATVRVRENGSVIAQFVTRTAGSAVYDRVVGWNANRTYKVTIGAAGRRTKSTSVSATTGAQPPSVSVRRGASCQTSACAGAEVACAGSCYYIRTTGHRFAAASTCRVTYADGGSSPYTWAQGNTETSSGGNWIAAGLGFRVVCGNGARSAKTVFSNPARSAGRYPSPVRNLHVVIQRDRAVTLRWNTPTRGPIRRYEISYPGRSAIRTGDTKVRIILPTNGERIPVSVRAVNRFGISPSARIVVVGAGRPAVPSQPMLALTEQPGSNSKGVQVTWSAVAANGPGPVEYQVLRAGLSNPLCDWQKGLSCLDELPYDGSTHSYRVRARNGEALKDPGYHLSGFSPSAKLVSAFTPDSPTINSFTATGNNNEVHFTFTANASHGAQNRIECQIGNGSCGDYTGFSPMGGGSGGDTVTGPPNGGVATLQLRSCNGSSAPVSQVGASCSPWASAQVTPYGPLGTPTISASPSGDHINVNASWNANGKNATVTITESGTGTIASFTTVGASSSSYSRSVGYDTSKTYTITITDNDRSPASRGATDGATTPPPAPSVTVRSGAGCQTSACPGAQVGCADICYFVFATGHNFPTTATCQINYAAGGSSVTWNQGNSETNAGGNWIAPGLGFTVSCSNGAQSAQTTF